MEKLIEHTPLALIIVGAILLIVAAAGGWPNPAFQVNEPVWRVVLGFVAVMIVAIGVFLIWREESPRNLTTRFDKLPKYYGIKIVSPQAGASVGSWFEVSGTYAVKPEERVQLFIASPDRHNYWPQEIVQFDSTRKTWVGRCYIGGPPPQEATVLVALVGEYGRILCDYYKKVGQETDQWPSIERITDDIVECDSIWVRKTES